MAKMDKLLIICGPTATGKTSLGIHLAKKFNGEIVSADSRQVYRGMDIGTGKDLPVISNFQFPISNLKKLGLGCYTLEGIRVWMLDMVEPSQEFNVARYVDLAQKVIVDIWQRNKLPIIVGGTGLYIKGLIDGIETLGVQPDWELRRRLENLPAQNLFDLLSRTDPIKAASLNASDRKNPRRLIRAIEVASKKPIFKLNAKPFILDPLLIGLKTELKELYQRIDRRVEKRVNQGVEKEIKKLISKGYSWNLPAMSALGYQEWQDYFEGQATREEVIQKWKFDEHGYARRQLTWFKKDKRIKWFNISKPNYQNEVEKLVESWYTKTNAE
jgi:tRNA dimethylallyltransferase